MSRVAAHRSPGSVDFDVGKWVSLGTAVGAAAEATVASCLENQVLQFAFAGCLVCVPPMMAAKKPGETA